MLPSPATLNRIRRIFIESLHLNMREEDLAQGRRLDEAAGLDSIAVLEFVAAVEKEFGLVIEPGFLDLEFLGNLPRLASYIDERAMRSGTQK
jgi:acyl carrier protein